MCVVERRRRLRFRHVLLLTIVVSALLGISLGLLLQPNAPWIPEKPPEEGNRVEHPRGFSIVAPSGWESKVCSTPEDNYIYLAPPTNVPFVGPIRYHPMIGVALLERPPDRSGFTDGRFLEQPAFQMLEFSVGRGDYLALTILLQREGHWFRIRYRVPEQQLPSAARHDVPDAIWQFLRTFRYAVPDGATAPSET